MLPDRVRDGLPLRSHRAAYASRMSSDSVASGPALAVTGSTGWLGGLVAGDLAERGHPQRLVVRDASRAPVLPGAAVVQASYGDGGAAREALDGVGILFMVSAAEDEQRLDDHRTFVDAAVAAGVEHIVYVSFFGAAQDATFTLARDHWATEEHIKASGMRLDVPARQPLPGVHRAPGRP